MSCFSFLISLLVIPSEQLTPQIQTLEYLYFHLFTQIHNFMLANSSRMHTRSHSSRSRTPSEMQEKKRRTVRPALRPGRPVGQCQCEELDLDSRSVLLITDYEINCVCVCVCVYMLVRDRQRVCKSECL